MARTEKCLRGCFDLFGAIRAAARRCLGSDRWQPYLNVMATRAGQAVHGWERYPVRAKRPKASAAVRAAAVKRLPQDGYEPVWPHARWVRWKRPANLTEPQAVQLKELLQYPRKAVRAYLLRAALQRCWAYRAAYGAGRCLREGCAKARRSRLAPMQQVARMVRAHQGVVWNWFRAQGTVSAGRGEGLTDTAQLAMRTAYGGRTLQGVKIALDHRLGALPEPAFTHEFC